MSKRRLLDHTATILVALTFTATAARAQFSETQYANGCVALPSQSTLQAALVSAVRAESSGLHNQMWATIVDRDGNVCAVAFSGITRSAQWPGSRVISAQKANTANAFSLDASSYSGGAGQAKGLALSTANLYSAVQPGGSLYGLATSNPVDASIAYSGYDAFYGQANDPMVGFKVGGVNVFGGGLGLYAPGASAGQPAVLVGGVGVSGDTSCTDHDVAWRLRHNLGLDHLANVAGVSGDPTHPDNIVYDITANPNGGTGISAGGYGHPTCANYNSDPKTLPAVAP